MKPHPHYIHNHLAVSGSKEDIDKLISTVDAAYFGYIESNKEETPTWEVADYFDGVIIDIPLLETSPYDEIEALAVDYPELDFDLDWYEECGSFRGWFYISKGKPAGTDIVFNEDMCSECCLYEEECECVHEPIVHLSSVDAPF